MNTHQWDHMPRNSQWYAEYQKRVAEFLKREGLDDICTGMFRCPKCGIDFDDGGGCPSCGADKEVCEEPSFSWRSCDCCGSNLGGNREYASGYNEKTKEIQEYQICVDCVYHAAYGVLDDMTMTDMERLDREIQ